MKIRLLMLGKTRRAELRAVIDDYVKRISRHSPIEITEVRDGEAAIKKLDADRAATVVLLDAAGKNLDSKAFAKWLGELRDRGTREIIFVCGDADGFPAVPSRTRPAENFSQLHDLLPRTRSRHARRAALPRLRHPLRQPLSEIAAVV